jgi:hypothetical protein
MVEWNLYYARWLLSDGEEDRRVGEIFNWWVLDFSTQKGLTRSQELCKSALVAPDYHYRVAAEIVHLSKDACVIDFGLLAIGSSDQIPNGCREGDYVTGEFRINLPNHVCKVPCELEARMAHNWQVNGILADMAQLVSFDDNSQAPYWRESEIPYRDVKSTEESGPCRGYILKCTEASQLLET